MADVHRHASATLSPVCTNGMPRAVFVTGGASCLTGYFTLCRAYLREGTN